MELFSEWNFKNGLVIEFAQGEISGIIFVNGE